MAKNSSLHNARSAKKDEFYTQLTDIEWELKHYRQQFRDKVVLCNCDDPRVSNFFKYFVLNFEFLGLKEVIATCYKNQDADFFTANSCEQAVYLTVTKKILDKIIAKNGGRLTVESFKDIEAKPLKKDGDFRSPECIEFLKRADIVCTNPPFSLFREYIGQLMKYEKKFLVIGNKNALTYVELFPLIKSNKLWIGCTPMGKDLLFDVPDSFAEELKRTGKEGSSYKIVNGKVMGRSTCVWLTNLDHKKRHNPMLVFKKYTPDEYPKYDDYDAIEVSRVENIPVDYKGVMGVPISFLDKYCPEQFEIVAFRKDKGKNVVFTIEDEEKVSKAQGFALNNIDLFYPSATNITGMIKNAEGKINGKITYARILIKYR